MSRPRSTGGVLWGLLLISAGAIFLLHNLGFELPVWSGIARYWPILLIVWGCLKLIDYIRWRRAGEEGPLFGAGEVVLLIFVIIGGTALTAAANISPDLANLFEVANIDVWDITGNSYQYPEHYEQDAPAGSAIQVINRYGDVEIAAGDTDRIVLDVAKTVIARNQNEADELAKLLTYSIVKEGSAYRVISNFNRDENRVRGRRLKTSLILRVPRKSRLDVDNRNGAIDISGLTGDQKVTNAFGNLSVSKITGDVQLNNRNGDVKAEAIDGSLTVKNEFAGVEVKGVSGTLHVEHRNGSLEISEVKGNVTLSNAFGSISVRDVAGSVNAKSRMTSFEAIKVAGDVSVKNEFQSVRLEDVQGVADVTNRNGSVELRYPSPPRKDIRIKSEFGDVTVTVPATSTFSVDAKTRFGSANSDFSELSRGVDDERNSLSGRVGTSGPEIRIENRNGSITIEK